MLHKTDRLLICWIGETDLRVCEQKRETELGPIANAVSKDCAIRENRYAEIALISDYPKKRTVPYVAWLQQKTDSPVTLQHVTLEDPTDFEEIYKAAVNHTQNKQKEFGKEMPLTFHISPGTSQMAAVWIILSASKFRAQLIKSSREQGVMVASLPFEIAADYIPDLLKQRDRELEKLAAGLDSEAHEFKDIIHRSSEMKRVINRAQRAALRSLPVLVEGESGTGKELVARAIHNASPRKNKPFIPVNCGAISPSLIESELFGHIKGSFTGAVSDRKGHFECAHEGTIFLDEIGELPKEAQVKLLRVLQEPKITKLGSSKSISVDVRIIAATNRSLIKHTAQNKFREDLFYRLAVAVIKVPALKNRSGDISLLVDRFLKKINDDEYKKDPTYEAKTLSASAKNILLQHDWPGNVRELVNTLYRVTLWSIGNKISNEEMQEAILCHPESHKSLNDKIIKPIGDGISIQEIISDTAKHYLKLSMKMTSDNKTKAAKLLGLSNYQTLTNWLKKYNLE